MSYHVVCERVTSVAMGEPLTGHISTRDNPADISTKIIPSGMKWDHLVGLILYDLNDSHSWLMLTHDGYERFRVY
jgi:hypothetical protein